jgi:hypothetical protein
MLHNIPVPVDVSFLEQGHPEVLESLKCNNNVSRAMVSLWGIMIGYACHLKLLWYTTLVIIFQAIHLHDMHARLALIGRLATSCSANIFTRHDIQAHNKLCLAQNRGSNGSSPCYSISVFGCTVRNVVVAPGGQRILVKV